MSPGIEQQQQQVMKHIFYVTIRGNVENMCRARRHGKNIERRKSWNGSSRVRDEADNFIDYQLIYVENLVLEKNFYRLAVDKVFGEIVDSRRM